MKNPCSGLQMREDETSSGVGGKLRSNKPTGYKSRIWTGMGALPVSLCHQCRFYENLWQIGSCVISGFRGKKVPWCVILRSSPAVVPLNWKPRNLELLCFSCLLHSLRSETDLQPLFEPSKWPAQHLARNSTDFLSNWKRNLERSVCFWGFQIDLF